MGDSFVRAQLDPNSGDLAFLEYCKRYILKGLKKWVPEQKSLNIYAVQKNPIKDSFGFLERIYQPY